MAQRAWLRSSLTILMLAAATAAAGTPPVEVGGHLHRVAVRDVASYERGFTDGLNARSSRSRDGDYRAGYLDGRAKRESNAARSDGRDYARGYVDGYNRYRERVAVSSTNRAYAAGYRAGQADHTAMVTGDFTQGPAPALGYERGFTDGLNSRSSSSRDSDYRAGYRDGRAKRDSNAARSDGRDYARGYLDGYNRYRDRIAVSSTNRAYAAGYRAGQADHTAMVTGDFTQGPNPGLGLGIPLPRPGEDLVGRPSATLERDMKSLGYLQISGFKKGRESFTTWQSRAENKCLRIAARDGRVQTVTDVEFMNCS